MLGGESGPATPEKIEPDVRITEVVPERNEPPQEVGPRDYDRRTILAYLNNPMGTGVWRVSLRIRRAVQSEAQVPLAGVPAAATLRTSPQRDTINWLLTRAVGWPETEDDDRRALHARALRFGRGFIVPARFGARPARTSPRTTAADLARLSEAAERRDEAATYPDVEGIRSLFPNLRVARADDHLGLVSTEPYQSFTLSYDMSPQGDFVTHTISRQTAANCVELFRSFSSKMGFDFSSETEKIYTPEEATFLPYFVVLYGHLDTAISGQRAIRNELREVRDKALLGDPEDSIRSAGFAMEHLLREVYEQCFREVAHSSTLGGELRELAVKAYESVGESGPDGQEIDFETHHRELGAILSSPLEGDLKKGLVVTQHLLRQARRAGERLTRLEKASRLTGPKTHPLFDQRIFENIERAINLRNAASHRTTARITLHEAAVTARGLLNLAYWWSRRNEYVDDWGAPLNEVVQALLSRASKETLPSP